MKETLVNGNINKTKEAVRNQPERLKQRLKERPTQKPRQSPMRGVLEDDLKNEDEELDLDSHPWTQQKSANST